jgi:predicted signal transduction protein with EAL and GGDEF domain
MHRVVKWLPAALLTLHIAAKIYISEQSLLVDLLAYNLIWIAAVIAITQAPLMNDPIALACTCVAISFWGIGSSLNSYSNFYSVNESSDLLAQICYTLFYPFALIALPRVVTRGRKLNPIELLDAAIFGLGISSIATALFISRVFPDSLINLQDQFFSLLFPIGDLLLLTLAAVAAITHRLHPRALFLFLGFALFSLSDLLFLWLAINESYQFGQLTDDGWLLGIVLIALSFWSIPTRDGREITIHPIFIAISVFISPTLLAYSALRPGAFPIFIIAPTIATLFLAFIRMTIVIRQARNLGEEKVLARTDELTGLPNRRRLIADLETFQRAKVHSYSLISINLNQSMINMAMNLAI